MSPSFAVSLAALGISVLVAAWNVARFALDGPRLRVTLNYGELGDTGGLFSGPFKTATASRRSAVFGSAPRYHVEVGVLQVENVGRTALTVFEPSFDGGMHRIATRRLPGRHTVSPGVLYAYSDATTDRRVRLEPYDVATFLMDLDTPLRAFGKLEWKRPYLLRGSVRVAGRRARRRSQRHRAMRVSPAAKVILAQPSAAMVSYRAARRVYETRDDVAGFFCAPFADDVQAREQAEGKLTSSQVLDVLEENLPEGESAATYVSPILEALRSHDHLAPSDLPRSED